MTRMIATTFGVLLLGLALSACGGGGGGGGIAVAPAPAAPKFEAQFGAGFAAAYQASATAEPKDVVAGDVIAASLTAEPVPLAGG